MAFKAIALDPAQFIPWSALSDEALHERDAERRIVDESPGFPCRVSLSDAAVGERVILLPFEHHAVASPYRAAGPIFVREGAQRWHAARDVVPPMLRTRLLSVRAYDAAGMMRTAEVVQGETLEQCIGSMLDNAEVEYLHVHFARRGCYACRIERT
jgi:hypothetical protein